LTSMTPWYCSAGTVALIRETASLIFVPAGSA
jgi:hypothetical protein